MHACALEKEYTVEQIPAGFLSMETRKVTPCFKAAPLGIGCGRGWGRESGLHAIASAMHAFAMHQARSSGRQISSLLVFA